MCQLLGNRAALATVSLVVFPDADVIRLVGNLLLRGDQVLRGFSKELLKLARKELVVVGRSFIDRTY